MRAVVVLTHPREQSFTRAACDAAVRGLERAGHEVTFFDLYAMGFQPAMTNAEIVAYHSDEPILDPLVAQSAAALRAAQILVFVYPTWWSGLPAMLKGWLEKTMVPGVGFVFNKNHRVRPGLTHVRRIVGISTYGSPRAYVKAVNDNGRRTLMRALRLQTGLRLRSTWLPFYAIDTSTAEQRADFLARVESRMASL
ncbi:MAG: NAD(P)H-dependent oxidoreductase [Actinomycetota bacterium]|jgi:putative NADPH-quinone reductase